MLHAWQAVGICTWSVFRGSDDLYIEAAITLLLDVA